MFNEKQIFKDFKDVLDFATILGKFCFIFSNILIILFLPVAIIYGFIYLYFISSIQSALEQGKKIATKLTINKSKFNSYLLRKNEAMCKTGFRTNPDDF